MNVYESKGEVYVLKLFPPWLQYRQQLKNQFQSTAFLCNLLDQSSLLGGRMLFHAGPLGVRCLMALQSSTWLHSLIKSYLRTQKYSYQLVSQQVTSLPKTVVSIIRRDQVSTILWVPIQCSMCSSVHEYVCLSVCLSVSVYVCLFMSVTLVCGCALCIVDWIPYGTSGYWTRTHFADDHHHHSKTSIARQETK